MEDEILEGIDAVEHVVVFVTAPDGDSALGISRRLVEERLAACVNIIGGLTSVFTWKGKIEEERENLLVIKTRAERVPELIKRVKALHPYDVPEIIALPVVEGNRAYLEWINDVT